MTYLVTSTLVLTDKVIVTECKTRKEAQEIYARRVTSINGFSMFKNTTLTRKY